MPDLVLELSSISLVLLPRLQLVLLQPKLYHRHHCLVLSKLAPGRLPRRVPRVGGRAQSIKRTGAALLRIAKPAPKIKSQCVCFYLQESSMENLQDIVV